MPITILIVDDSSVMRAMIIKSLRMSGLIIKTIHQAANGVEGLQVLKSHKIDLVIVDINMPVMDGQEMLEQMCIDQNMTNIPTIVISTEGSQKRREWMASKGAVFIHKPFLPRTIRNTVKKLMNVENQV